MVDSRPVLKDEPGRLEEALKATVHAVAGEPLDILKAELLEVMDRADEAKQSLVEALSKQPGTQKSGQLVLLHHQKEKGRV